MKKRYTEEQIIGAIKRHAAQSIIEEWRYQYNHVRPHSALGYLPPAVYAQQAA